MILIIFFIAIAFLFAWAIPQEEVDAIRKVLKEMKIINQNTSLLTSEDWHNILSHGWVVMDPDGWDRSNYQYSWFEELITKDEYYHRLMNSTCLKHHLNNK